METRSAPYGLKRAQFDQALVILKREQEAYKPSRWEEITYILLNVAVYGYVVFWVAFFVAGFLTTYEGFNDPVPTIAGSVSSILEYILFATSGLAVLVISSLLVLNLSSVQKLQSQQKLMRKLGLSEAANAPWRAKSRKERLLNLLTLIAGLLLSWPA